MQHWIRFATDDEQNAQCAAGEAPSWWRRFEVNGARFQPKAIVMGIGSDAKVAGPDHVIGGKGKHVTVCMYEPELEAGDQAINCKLLDGLHTPPTPDPYTLP